MALGFWVGHEFGWHEPHAPGPQTEDSGSAAFSGSSTTSSATPMNSTPTALVTSLTKASDAAVDVSVLEEKGMNRRALIKGMVAAAAVASPLAVQADEVTDWAAWWERSKKYTLQIAEAMPAADYTYVPFGSGTGDGGDPEMARGRSVN
jgi:hypothetical protein